MTDLAELTESLRAYLIEQGATPGTAYKLSIPMAERAHAAIERDQLERKAQLLLALGPTIAAERLGVCKATIYNMVHRLREKSKKIAAV